MSAMNRIEVTILEELALAVKRRGSQEEFAQAVGISQPYLSQILNGRRSIARLPIATGQRLSQVSGIPFERLAAAEAPLAPDA
jgi:transcriptional regulator with XRE-family HTH domain